MRQRPSAFHDPLRALRWLWILAPSLSLLFVACVETDGPPITKQFKQATCPQGVPPRSAVNPDVISNFFPCCDGTAHLIPEFLIPLEYRSMLESGPNKSLCVPDEFATDATFTPEKCTSIFGQPGACLSVCIPQVRDSPIELPKANCTGNQLCAPCVDPRTEQPTGACKMGDMACDYTEVDGPCTDYEPTLDVSKYPSCCLDGQAHCAPGDLVPENSRALLGTCNGGYCVPDNFLKRGGRYTPPTCKSVGGREGRCLSVCIAQIAEQKDTLPVASCKPDERCAPCYDPRTGMGTGACNAGPCDKGPSEAPQTFTPCGAGSDDAFCVPSDLIPDQKRPLFDNLGCAKTPCPEAGTLCVPKKIIDAGPTFTPKKCTNPLTGYLAFFLLIFSDYNQAMQAMNEYSEGRCLSQCIPQVREQAQTLGQQSCDEKEICVPCFDPTKIDQGKVSTGACDR
jgi:hypothetical protein